MCPDEKVPPDDGRVVRVAQREAERLGLAVQRIFGEPVQRHILKHARLIFTYRMSARMSDYLYTHPYVCVYV